jgi:ElaB/YqjD/DUF883 family membrane-anchored ribosome-binding protein
MVAAGGAWLLDEFVLSRWRPSGTRFGLAFVWVRVRVMPAPFALVSNSRRLDGGPGHTLNQSSLSFVVQRGSILEKQTMVERQRSTQDITLDTYELTDRIADIREDLQKLISMVGRLANSQLSRTQDAAVRAVDDFEEAIRRNPLSALGVAFGFGFLFAIFMRR